MGKIYEICGERWPRLLNLQEAAAYCRMSLPSFRAEENLCKLIKPVFGQSRVDRLELDRVVSEEISKQGEK